MGSFFLTENETEDYLALETREIPMPDGSLRAVSAFKLLWRSWDYLLEWSCYGPHELTALALVNASEVGCSFEESLRDTLSVLHRDLRRTQGID